MRDILIAIVFMTVTGSVLFLVNTIMSPITKRIFTRQWHYHYLKIAAIFFLIPIFSIISSFSPSAFYSASAIAKESPFLLPMITYANLTDIDLSGMTLVQNSQAMTKMHFNGWNIGGIVWVAGALITFIRIIIKNHLFMKALTVSSSRINDEATLATFQKIKKSMHIVSTIELYQSSSISTPMLVGCMKPKVVLPARAYDEVSLSFIFRHELNHYLSKDIAVKRIISIVYVLHWFNPLCYQFAALLELYQEMACDENVIRQLNSKALKTYSNIILESCSSLQMQHVSHAPFVGSKKNVKRRLMSIMNPKLDTRKKSICGAMLLLVAFILPLTNIFVVYASTYSFNPNTMAGGVNPIDHPSISTNDTGLYSEEKTSRTLAHGLESSAAASFELPIKASQAVISDSPVLGYDGVEIRAAEGTSVYASASGRVIKSVENQNFGYGKYIVIDHGDGYQSLYAHNNSIFVLEGDTVQQGDIIAEVGRSGNATDYMLYYEIFLNGASVNVQDMIQPQ